MTTPYYEDPADFKANGSSRQYDVATGMAIARPGSWVNVIDEINSGTRQGAVAGTLWHLAKRLNRDYGKHSFEYKTLTHAGRIKGYIRTLG